MSLHEAAIDWVVSQTPNSVNNHYGMKLKIYPDSEEMTQKSFVVPDVIEDGKGVFHEVEVLDVEKDTYLAVHGEKHLWLVLKGLMPFKRTCVVLAHNDSFTPLFNIDPETGIAEVISLDAEIEKLRSEIADLTTYLDSYDMKQLKNLRKRERELQTLVERLTKQKWYIDLIKNLSGPEIKVDKNCKKCPFFVSWMKETYHKEFGVDPYLKMKEVEVEEGEG